MKLSDHRVSARVTVAKSDLVTMRHWQAAFANMKDQARQRIAQMIMDKHMRASVFDDDAETYVFEVLVFSREEFVSAVREAAQEMVKTGMVWLD
jgi:hypothetical protein